MKKSILFRQIILLLLAGIMLSGVLSSSIYIFVTQRMYVQMRANELSPIAHTIADMISDTQQRSELSQSMLPLLRQNNRNFGATLHICNIKGESIMNPSPNTITNDSHVNPLPNPGKVIKKLPSEEVDLMQEISDDLQSVLADNELSETRKLSNGESFLVVGVPIKNENIVIGAVIFTKPLSELSNAMYGMNVTLVISTLISFLIMLIPGYYAAKQLAVPIRKMKDVAHAMSKGDFSVRADESLKGEIGELGYSINHFAAESERLEQTRRDYVANVSHELRTPISAIRAMGETLRDGMAKSETKQSLFYGNIVRESMRLSRLVDDLLELSHLQSSTEAIQKDFFDLCEVIQNITDIYSHVATEAKLQFLLCSDIKEPSLVFSNSDRIEQVLVVLLDNAMKHTSPNGTITLSTENKGDHIEIRVSDTGEGIPADDLPHIFERFYKVDKSHSGEGTGLGLSIAYEIINTLNETILVESSPSSTNFTLTIHKK